MAEFDLFDLTGLLFDPPEKAAKKVKEAIEKAIKELSIVLGSSTLQLEREKINEKFNYLNTIKTQIFETEKCDKLTDYYSNLAQKRVDKEMEILRSVVNLLKLSGKCVITNGAIRTQKMESKLSKKNIESVYINAGFTLTEIDSLSAMPKFPTNAEKIYNELATLRKSPNPNSADFILAHDLYAFAACLQNEPENAAIYKSMENIVLANIFDDYARKNSSIKVGNKLIELCVNIAIAGKIYVFNSEDNRRAYDNFLLYKSSVLTELFATIKRVPSEYLKDEEFANFCIKQIQEIFGDFETALAIYNKEAGIKDNPYIIKKTVSALSEEILEKLSRSCGVAIFTEYGYMIENFVFIGDLLPVEVKRKYITQMDNQSHIEMDLFENISQDRLNKYVKPCLDEKGNEQYTDPALKVKYISKLIIDLPVGTPKSSLIEVAFRFNTNGLEVKARNLSTNQFIQTTILSENKRELLI